MGIRRALSTKLDVVRQLVERLEADHIPYCHWKSNATLHDSLLGIVDLDLLVVPTAALPMARVLGEVGFKPVVPVPCLTYPAISEFLALDRATGRLVHLHLYYRLVTGEGHLKGYHLPWEHLLLSTRQFDPAGGIYVADPSVEMILFMVRAALRVRATDRLLGPMGRPHFRGVTLRELRWLKERSSLRRVKDIGQHLLGPECTHRLLRMLDGTPSTRQVLAFRASARAALHPHRRYGGLEAVWHRWVKELGWARSVLSLRYLPMSFPTRRTPATGGLMVAFTGPDGSGKSTLAGAVAQWLGGKVDVLPVYFGSGQGPASFLRWSLQVIAGIAGRKRYRLPNRGECAGSGTAGVNVRKEAFWWIVGRTLWAVTLSLEKRRTLRRARRAQGRGMVVVCDRFPQNQVMGFMDGPLLAHWRDHRSGALRTLARWERVPYEWAEVHPPDVVIHLNVSPEVALRRKPEMSIAEISRRVHANKTLRFRAGTRMVTMDADRPLDELLLRVKALIWDTI